MIVQRSQCHVQLMLAAALTVFVAACAPDPSAPSDDRFDVSAAKATSTTDMSVSSATPDSATQDTTLDVVINGSGFVSGTQANWSLAGVQDPAQVRTNNTRYVSPRQLVANITISGSATVAKWDIVVTAAGKKGGIGTEAFAVKVRRTVIPTIPLVVTISDTDASGLPYRIRGDGQGVYTDGVQGVQAVLDQYGTFAFNTAASTANKAALRWVVYDFNDPVDPSNTYRPNPSNAENYHFATGGANNIRILPIQNLGVNGNPSSECIYMGNSFAYSMHMSWRVSFHAGLEDVPTTPTAYAVVTRVSVSPAVWTIAPSGSCSPISNVASLRSGDGFLYGYYNLPFFFTLRSK